MAKKINWIICHHTGGVKDNPRADTSHHTFTDINAWHRQDPNVWLGHYSLFGYAIGYTYFIDKAGNLTQGRSDTEQAAHTPRYNNNSWDLPENGSIGICLAGNFDVTFPTPEQVKTLETLLLKKRAEYGFPIEHIVPHRYASSKSCYGRNLSDDWAANLLRPVNATSCTEKDAEIKELKQKVAWYKSAFSWLRTPWS